MCADWPADDNSLVVGHEPNVWLESIRKRAVGRAVDDLGWDGAEVCCALVRMNHIAFVPACPIIH